MNAPLRQTACAIGVLVVCAVCLGAATSTALAIRETWQNASALGDQLEALKVREKRLVVRGGRDLSASPFFEARTVTLAGAAMQQRLEAAVAGATGRLVSSKLEVGLAGDERALVLSAELTIAETDIQRLLFDLETGRPYVFVSSLEARAPEAAQGGGGMRVSLTASGQWSQTK